MDLATLQEKLEALTHEVQELRDALRDAFRLTDEYPNMSLLQIRIVLETVLRDLYARHISESGTPPLENVIEQLIRKNIFPKELEGYENAIRKVGNIVAHKRGTLYSVEDVYRSLLNLLPILEWYIRVGKDHPPIARDLGSKPDKSSKTGETDGSTILTPAPKVEQATAALGAAMSEVESSDSPSQMNFEAILGLRSGGESGRRLLWQIGTRALSNAEFDTGSKATGWPKVYEFRVHTSDSSTFPGMLSQSSQYRGPETVVVVFSVEVVERVCVSSPCLNPPIFDCRQNPTFTFN